MALPELLKLPADQRARIAVALLESLSPQEDDPTPQSEEALIRERDAGEFLSEAEFFAPFHEAGYGKSELY